LYLSAVESSLLLAWF